MKFYSDPSDQVATDHSTPHAAGRKRGAHKREGGFVRWHDGAADGRKAITLNSAASRVRDPQAMQQALGRL